MFHAASLFRFLSFASFLPLRQGITTPVFYSFYRRHVFRSHDIFHSDIPGVKPRRFPVGLLGRLRQHMLRLLEVMTAGGANRVAADKLGPVAYLHVVLIPVEPLSAFLHPLGIYVLVALLVEVVVPQLDALAFLYLLGFLACVALPWGND